MTLAERIREAMGDMSPADLARATKKTPGAVTQWLDGTIKSLKGETASVLQTATGYNSNWLATGKGPKKPEQSFDVVSGGEGVPLISWVTAGMWADVSDPYHLGEAEEWLPCPVRHGSRTYCLRVRGDSMNNPNGRPSYADGDIIFVDPDRGSKAGDRVIVRLDDQQEATFKQLLIEDGRKLLKALNPEWSPRYIEINGNATITGVVIGKWVPE